MDDSKPSFIYPSHSDVKHTMNGQFERGESDSSETESEDEMESANEGESPVVAYAHPSLHRPHLRSPSSEESSSVHSKPPSLASHSRLSTPIESYSEQHERRSSSRSVKRKKFADEIVEASLRPAYYRHRSGEHHRSSPSKLHPGMSPASSYSSSMESPRPAHSRLPHAPSAPSLNPRGNDLVKVEKLLKRKSELGKGEKRKDGTKKQRTDSSGFFYGGEFQMAEEAPERHFWSGNARFGAEDLRVKGKDTKSVSKHSSSKKPRVDDESRRQWTAMDDLKLITALQQLCDFQLVAKYVSFSIKLDAAALEHYWTQLLDDPRVCRLSIDGLDKIPLDTIQRIRKMKFLTTAEEEAIRSVTPGHANLETFEKLIRSHAHIFFPGRTPEDCLVTWKYLSQRIKTEFGAAPPLTNPELPEDLEAARLRNRIRDVQTRASCFGKELISLTNHLNYRSKHIACEVAYLKALGERVGSGTLPDQTRPKFQRDLKSALACLSGVCVDYAITTDEVTFGYSDENVTVDVDLSLEGNIVNLQPLQGTIFLDVEGNFHIENQGAFEIAVNGMTLLANEDAELRDDSTLEVGTLTFQFYTNPGAIRKHVERAVMEYTNRVRGVRNHQNTAPQNVPPEAESESDVDDENGMEQNGLDSSQSGNDSQTDSDEDDDEPGRLTMNINGAMNAVHYD
ncbi:uncharacterized protein LOC129587717 [Paramacrobiotus metropolitanus]|uniref:uncharacterized protein LOC129587717 n=1 Tax=Paramacrobiotus metropolitanus TaxID=2943436 RepID=UPI002445C515|nr:uncharacterized protein LOC129587717 [Paramacrobiotus metropolitanus]